MERFASIIAEPFIKHAEYTIRDRKDVLHIFLT